MRQYEGRGPTEAAKKLAHNLTQNYKQQPGQPDAKKKKESSSYKTSHAGTGIELSQTGGAGTVDEGPMDAYGLRCGRRQFTGIFVT